ncbi:VanZ family protein [Promicromonospora sp. MS192]|uniref:VanZ family protein n=1 Tax=Promicromonospora sp. MS192 TaxID=3412684 RepID=UPI003C2D82E6
MVGNILAYALLTLWPSSNPFDPPRNLSLSLWSDLVGSLSCDMYASVGCSIGPGLGNLVGNFLMLLPLGFIVPIRWRLQFSPWAILAGVGIPILNECLQYALGTGRIATPADVVLQSLGYFLGYGACLALLRVSDSHRMAG